MPDGPLTTDIAAMLGLAAQQARNIRLEPCGTGGNNRVFLTQFDGRKLVVKQYYRHPSDPRDRLHSEDAFLRYAVAAGVTCVPRPVAADARLGLGVYEYIEGRKLESSDVSAVRVNEAAEFFIRLNDPAHRATARMLPAASEACFSIGEHFLMVDRRTAQLATIPSAADVDIAARDFAANLAARWNEVKRRITSEAPSRGQSLDAPVAEQCVSPSDFGFHNALVRKTGEVCFLDFEYAGWDDPAKMVGDFFSHPAVPVPREHFDRFVQITMGYSPHARALEARARLLLPVFQVKWCCIILNEFIPEFALRRRFADPEGDEGGRKRRQLEKARQLFASMEG